MSVAGSLHQQQLLGWHGCSQHHSLCPAVHFWAPTFKWGISIANIADMQRPAEKVSTPQQCGEPQQRGCSTQLRNTSTTPCLLTAQARPGATQHTTNLLSADLCPPPAIVPAAVTCTGLIWTRYSTQITPINYNLMTVNCFMAATGMYQLYRKFM